MIFVCQSFVDCISYCFGSLTFRLLQNGLLPPQWFDTAMVGKLVFFLASFGSFFEFTAHVTIATNRFTAIVWSGKSQVLIISCVFLVALAFASIRFFMDIRLAKTAEGFALVNVDRAWSIPSAVTSAAVALVSCTISFTLEVTTLVVYRRMNAQTQRQHRDDYRLLVYAMMGLVAQSLMAAYFAIVLTAGNLAPAVTATAQKAVPYIVDLLSLGGSLCLLFTSRVVRKSYLEMYSCGNVRLRDTSTVLVRTITPQT
ncbi:hypothetical protein AAVH_14650 [Aphelenchoides avenae]|nr:hypothetical protein AAVH_14650 [Aphelenchus avenae]